MKNSLAIGMCLLLVLPSLMAQQRLKGKVMAFKGFGLKGVEVKAKRSGHTATTDSLGNFELIVKHPDQLRVKAKGFKPMQQKYHGHGDVALNLIYMDNTWAYDQIVTNGYMSKEDLDYCIEHLLSQNNNFDRMADIFQVIQSVYPQAKVAELRGQQRIFLNSRGAQSIIADADALVVVDGVVTENFAGIQPSKVADVKVLLGNEASYYGTRGGNGVVEITLKQD